MSDTLTGNPEYDAIAAAIKAFKFWDYGLDETNPNSEYAEWVPDLAGEILKAVGAPAAPAGIEQRLRSFVAELELAERASQAPLPYDLLIATLRHRVLDPSTPDTTGSENAEAAS